MFSVSISPPVLVTDLLAAECVDFVFHSAWATVTGVVVKSSSSLCSWRKSVPRMTGVMRSLTTNKLCNFTRFPNCHHCFHMVQD